MADNFEAYATGLSIANSGLGILLGARDIEINQLKGEKALIQSELDYYSKRYNDASALVDKYLQDNKRLEEKVGRYEREMEKLEAEIDSLKAKLKAKKK